MSNQSLYWGAYKVTVKRHRETDSGRCRATDPVTSRRFTGTGRQQRGRFNWILTGPHRFLDRLLDAAGHFSGKTFVNASADRTASRNSPQLRSWREPAPCRPDFGGSLATLSAALVFDGRNHVHSRLCSTGLKKRKPSPRISAGGRLAKVFKAVFENQNTSLARLTRGIVISDARSDQPGAVLSARCPRDR